MKENQKQALGKQSTIRCCVMDHVKILKEIKEGGLEADKEYHKLDSFEFYFPPIFEASQRSGTIVWV